MSIRHVHARPGQHIVVHRGHRPRHIHHDHYHTEDGNYIKWIIIGALVLIGTIIVCRYWEIIVAILILGALCGSAKRK